MRAGGDRIGDWGRGGRIRWWEILLLLLVLAVVLVRAGQGFDKGRIECPCLAIDGDTLSTVGRERVRLTGFDAPEICESGGREAKRYLQDILDQARRVEMGVVGTDRYGRLLAEVVADGVAVAKLMRAAGFTRRRGESRPSCPREDYRR